MMKNFDDFDLSETCEEFYDNDFWIFFCWDDLDDLYDEDEIVEENNQQKQE